MYLKKGTSEGGVCVCVWNMNVGLLSNLLITWDRFPNTYLPTFSNRYKAS